MNPKTKIRDCMKSDVVSISVSSTVAQAVAAFTEKHIGILPVVDDAGRLVGILTLRSLLALVMPDFVRLMDDFDFVHDFGAVEAAHPSQEVLAHSVREVMQPPSSVAEDCGLLRAFALLRHYDLQDLPVVVPGGQLIGIASRVDVGVALLENWRTAPKDGAL
jgi:CBS domain-containing protein